MSMFPGNYAVPGVMWPGDIWPGEPITIPAGPAVTVTAGLPYLQWAAGSPDQDWITGVPYGV